MAKISATFFLLTCLSVATYAYNELELDSADQKTTDYWCIAKANVSEGNLRQLLDNLCSKVDCGPIQPGGACFHPNTVQAHASYALNLNFQTVAPACNWQYATVTSIDPSYGNCHYHGPPNRKLY